MNKVILVGRIVNDLVLNRTKSGLDYLRFNLAIERRKFSADSEEITDFIPVVAWRFHAINIYTLSTKGSLILIEGYLSSGRYQKDDGTNVFTLDVVVDSFRSLETKEQLEQRKRKMFLIQQNLLWKTLQKQLMNPLLSMQILQKLKQFLTI